MKGILSLVIALALTLCMATAAFAAMPDVQWDREADVVVIGCGGAGKALIPYIKEITAYEPDMVSRGLHYIYHNYYE